MTDANDSTDENLGSANGAGDLPNLSAELVKAGAIAAGVCVRPIVREVIDTQTGNTQLIPIPCQATLASKCQPCAERARRLRMQQCREGWHLDTEPADKPRSEPPVHEPGTSCAYGCVDCSAPTHLAHEEETPEPTETRRTRSTRRRNDVPDLPRLPVEARTVGRTFTAPDGKTWRPSMFLTCTMPSYGPVNDDGTPKNPSTYDYRRAALDALHFPKLWDRLVQNLRRAVGYEVQYFAAIEPQRRLAPHVHTAIRGAIPRALLREVIAATYATVWWPAHDRILYSTSSPPAWDVAGEAYCDPDTGQPLPAWSDAVDSLEVEHGGPAHVLRFGKQSDIQGLIAGTSDADRRIGYLTKYLTKAIVDPIDDGDAASSRREAHIDRLHREVRHLPCSPKCWNWLHYGVQPKDADAGMVPGQCPSKAHDREHLGCGGRRVLVSRKWTGKTLTEHKADRYSAVRTVLEAAGIDLQDADRCSATATQPDGSPRFVWQTVDLDDIPTYHHVIAQSVAESNRWRDQYEEAKRRAGPPFSNSANGRAA
ncbi:replication initiator [Tenggerimyces flavus]|uniref:Replication initiator n=1 Tax=Tenggerimyces flavus TaxID=1708749 RepID=A0ABV7YC57_9ACTN|nr:replication initiator [Tenggerimyces flavus]MBM7783570.1 hypothetical protein [Tenggerimyces flavus]